MVQLLTLLDTIFYDKLVPRHLIFLRTLHTVAKLLEWSFWTILWGEGSELPAGFLTTIHVNWRSFWILNDNDKGHSLEGHQVVAPKLLLILAGLWKVRLVTNMVLKLWISEAKIRVLENMTWNRDVWWVRHL